MAIPLAGSYWPEGGRTYQVQVRFTPTSGDAYVAALYELQAVEAIGEITTGAKQTYQMPHVSGSCCCSRRNHGLPSSDSCTKRMPRLVM